MLLNDLIQTLKDQGFNKEEINKEINNMMNHHISAIMGIICKKTGHIILANEEGEKDSFKKDSVDIYSRIVKGNPISKKEQEYLIAFLNNEKAKEIAQIEINKKDGLIFGEKKCHLDNFINKTTDLLKNYPFVVDFEVKNVLRVDENIYRYDIIKDQKLLQGLIIINENNDMILSENYEKISYLGNGLFFVIEEETESELEEKVGEEKEKNNEDRENEEKKLKYGKILLFNGKMMELYREKNIKSMEIIEDNGEKYILTTDCSLQKGLLKLETEGGIIELNKIIENENFKIILENGVIFAIKNKKDNEGNNMIGLLRAYYFDKKENKFKKECLGHIFKDKDLIFYGENKDILEVNTAGDNIRSFFKFDKNGIGLIKGLGNIKSSFPKYSGELLSDFIDGIPIYIKYNNKEEEKDGIVLKSNGIIYFIDLKKYFSINSWYKNFASLGYIINYGEDMIYKEIINRFKFINGKAYLLKNRYKIIEGEKNTEDFNVTKKFFDKGVNINAPWEKIKKYYKEIKIEEIGSFEESDLKKENEIK